MLEKIPAKKFREEFDKFLRLCEAEGEVGTGLEITSADEIVFPYRRKGGNKVEALVPSILFRVRNTTNDHQHTVVLAWTPDGTFKLWCADGLFVSSSSKYCEIYDQYVEECKKCGIGEHHVLSEEVLATDDQCSFWRKQTCKHTKHVQNFIALNGDRVFQKLDELRQEYFSEQAEESEKGDFAHTLRSLAFKSPVLIEGEQGSGKTYTAYQLAQDLLKAGEVQHLVIGQGDNGVETADLLGYYIKAPDGSLVWKDGVLTEAFRKAQTGKTILLFDEFYRLRDREKDIFVRALTVWGDGKLRLRTGRVMNIEDGVAQEEVIEIPKENLWVIATTNIGSQFMVDEADPALQERFVILRKDTEEDELRKILMSKCDEYEIPHTVIGMLVKFWKVTKKKKLVGGLSGYATTRTLVRAIELAPTKDKEGVREALWMQRYLWIGRDSNGFPIPEQEETLREILDECFS